jgi:hypothetical protein
MGKGNFFTFVGAAPDASRDLIVALAIEDVEYIAIAADEKGRPLAVLSPFTSFGEWPRLGGWGLLIVEWPHCRSGELVRVWSAS